MAKRRIGQVFVDLGNTGVIGREISFEPRYTMVGNTAQNGMSVTEYEKLVYQCGGSLSHLPEAVFDDLDQIVATRSDDRFHEVAG